MRKLVEKMAGVDISIRSDGNITNSGRAPAAGDSRSPTLEQGHKEFPEVHVDRGISPIQQRFEPPVDSLQMVIKKPLKMRIVKWIQFQRRRRIGGMKNELFLPPGLP